MAIDLKKGLQAISRDLKLLAKKLDSIQQQVEKVGKKKAAEAKPAKKTPAKRAAAKKPAGRKPATAAAKTLAIIGRYKRGVNTAKLMTQTGYDKKKVANLVFKLRKQGKIKTEKKGVYLKA